MPEDWSGSQAEISIGSFEVVQDSYAGQKSSAGLSVCKVLSITKGVRVQEWLPVGKSQTDPGVVKCVWSVPGTPSDKRKNQSTVLKSSIIYQFQLDASAASLTIPKEIQDYLNPFATYLFRDD